MSRHPPPFPAYGDLTAAAAAAAAGYTAAAPGYGQPRTAEGLVPRPAYYGYPAHGSPAFTNAGFHGVVPGQPYAMLPGHAYAPRVFPSHAGFDGVLPGHAYDAAGLRDAAFLHGYAYASPGQGHQLVVESNQRNVDQGRGGFNPGARSFESRGTNAQQMDIYSVRRQDSLEAAGGALNPGPNPWARSYDRRDTGAQQGVFSSAQFDHTPQAAGRALNVSRQAGGGLNPSLSPVIASPQLANDSPQAFDSRPDAAGGLNRSFDRSQQDAGAPWRSLPGLHQISPSLEWSNRVLLGNAQVKQIWRQNCLEAFQEIRQLMLNLKGCLYIAIDLEYLASATTDINCNPKTSEEWYKSLQSYVNDGSIVQIGLAFASEEKNSEIVAYEFNMLVDVTKGTFHEKAVDFLKSNHHDLDMHKKVGILPEWIWAGVLKNLPFGREDVVWVAYHGDRDIGFILRMLEGGDRRVQLPQLLESFLHMANERFPLYYDVKVLGKLVKEGFRGKLKTLAGDEFLNVKRTGGDHHAGSDALLTMRCFAKILQEHKLEALVARKCIMSGIGELRLPITCYRHVSALDISVVEVYNSNFDQEAFYISQTIQNNFRLIGIQIIAPKDLRTVEWQYNTIRAEVQEVKKFDLLLAFMNVDGNLAFGRAWKIFLQVEDEDENRVSILRLAALLASSRATHSTSSVWVTFQGESVLALLLQAFISPGALPASSARYDLARASLFPKVCDMKVLAELCTGHSFIGDLRDTAVRLGVVVDACDAITILRCFYSLRGEGSMCIDDHS